ncbi:histidine kinase (plasmid) [Phyllobacteriaceae bacterium JZ32]
MKHEIGTLAPAGLGLSPAHETMSSRVARRLWNGRSIRWQLLATFLLINLAAGIAAAVTVIYNAQRATEIEIAASMEVAERFVRGSIGHLVQAGDRPPAIENLLQISNLRHVRIQVFDNDGDLLSSLPAATSTDESEEESEVPHWFSALIKVEDLRREVPIVSGNQRLGTVLLVGEASDEVAEVWQDVTDLAIVAIILNLTVIGALYLALGRVLHPLTDVSRGLCDLEEGHFRGHLARPKVRELQQIVDRFNALADHLAAAKADNARINRRLVTIQDDERRQVAMELHDELGPCVFGIRSKITSLKRLAGSLPGEAAEKIRKRVDELGEITEKIRAMNRDLLRRLRPMALGNAPLADVIAGLLADFERHGAPCSFSLETGRLARSYGDCIDLTAYRCIQEGITNAIQHGQADHVEVRLLEEARPVGNGFVPIASAQLLCMIRDNGRGIAPGTPAGFGLTGIEERVRAIGGSFSITNPLEGGTLLDISLPLEEQRQFATGSNQQARGGI